MILLLLIIVSFLILIFMIYVLVYFNILSNVPLLIPSHTWSIGIYTGNSPFSISPSSMVKNPVLTYKNIPNIPVKSVSDPFMIYDNMKWYMFFEIYNLNTTRGEIGLAVSEDGYKWHFDKIIISEPFHLSFPYVFKVDDSYYMVPESAASLSVRLYKADNFPTQWSWIANLIDKPYVDNCVLYFNNYWWLFSFDDTKNSLALHLFYSKDILGQWESHPKNPIVTGADKARPGGRIIKHDGMIIRYAQDGSRGYGKKIRAFQITKITTSEYDEKEILMNPVLEGSGSGWNAQGMHHIDPHHIAEHEWLACVDGRTRKLRFISNIISVRLGHSKG